jgi:hypothetical protein
MFDAEIVQKIRARIEKLPPVAPQQSDLGARFDRLLSSSWSTESEHKKLLKSAALENELAFVGARYRAVLDVVRDEPRAKAAQQELLTLAMATMSKQKDLGELGEGKGSNRAALIGMLIVMAILAAAIAVVAKNIARDAQLSGSGSID